MVYYAIIRPIILLNYVVVAKYFDKRDRMQKKLKGEASDEESGQSDEADSATEGDKLLPKKIAPIHVGADSKRD